MNGPDRLFATLRAAKPVILRGSRAKSARSRLRMTVKRSAQLLARLTGDFDFRFKLNGML
jgi:hypothetical protein